MIPREMLKKIRPSELHPNRSVTTSAAAAPSCALVGDGGGVEIPIEDEMCPILRFQAQKPWFLRKNRGWEGKSHGSTEFSRGWTEIIRCWAEFSRGLMEIIRCWTEVNRCGVKVNRGSEAINQGRKAIGRNPDGCFHFSPS